MGKLIVEQIITADGFAADADGGLKFVRPDDTGSHIDREQLTMLESVDAILLGANTYRIFAGFWPTADAAADPVAVPINALPRHVISSTLDEAPWGDLRPAILERGDAIAIVARLKEQYAGNVIVWGSLTLTDALFAAGLVDILRLRTLPVLIGDGRRFSPAGLEMTFLTLTASKTHAGGQVTLQYDVTR